MNTKLIIFDLDGTLLNTIGDLAAAMNAVLAQHQLSQHTYEEYTQMVGNGIRLLVERALPETMRDPETVETMRLEFVDYYTQHIDIHTKPYEGTVELLRELNQRGIRMGVASNKFQSGTEQLVGEFFGDIPFVAVLGQRPNIPLKPDPAIAEEIIRKAGVEKSETLYVGDSGVDMQTATAAGLRKVGCTWGFRTREELAAQGADHLIDRAEELLALV